MVAGRDTFRGHGGRGAHSEQCLVECRTGHRRPPGRASARARTHPRPPPPALAEILRPSGYFRVKAERLRGLCRWYLARLETRDTETIRADLLAVHGIGPETADDILLYALDRPVFVIDAYTGAFSRASDGSRDTRTTRHCGRGSNASWARTSRSTRSTTPSSCITPRGSAAPGRIASVAASQGAALGPSPIDTGWPRVERRGEMLNYELQDVKKL